MSEVRYVVKAGDSLSLIARKFGFMDYKTIYNHPENAAFKEKRPNPNLISPGDVIIIPEKKQKTAQVQVGGSVKITVKCQRQILRLRLVSGDSALKNETYSLYIKGSGSMPELLIEGKRTDSDGIMEEEIPSEYLEAGSAEIVSGGIHFTVLLGGLDPIEKISGIKQRLRNLGFPISSGNELDDNDVASIMLFKKKYGLETKGNSDEDFRRKLCEVHDNSNSLKKFED
jgi:N-acetylmuramoyl-L-alanine amidase